jgi:hypothetical protein
MISHQTSLQENERKELRSSMKFWNELWACKCGINHPVGE